jgi:hypothetical protein
MNGFAWDNIICWAMAFLLIVGRRVLASHLVRSHPEWSAEKKSAIQGGLAVAAIVIFGITLVVTSRI